jgi:hypothetical protein
MSDGLPFQTVAVDCYLFAFAILSLHRAAAAAKHQLAAGI